MTGHFTSYETRTNHEQATRRKISLFCMRDLADTHYPAAEQIRIVMDNLSTHTAGALYETFTAPEAHRILTPITSRAVAQTMVSGFLVFISVSTAATTCAGRNGLATSTLLGTPLTNQSWVPSPFI